MMDTIQFVHSFGKRDGCHVPEYLWNFYINKCCRCSFCNMQW